MSKSARQVQQFWAEMRSTAYLFSKSTWPSNEQASRLISELQHILGERIITYPPTLAEFGIDEKTSYEQKKLYLGLDKVYNNSNTHEADRRFAKFMANKAANAQKGNWCWRISEEATQKQMQDWYPFFVTLTIDPKLCMGQTHEFKGRKVSYSSPRDLWEQGREFRLYIRSLAKTVSQLCGHPPPHKEAKNWKNSGIDYTYRPESDYCVYAGVLEHGKTNEHHHMHLMLWLKEIPSHWKLDPNEGRSKQYRVERECKPLRNFWPWCIPDQKPALYFRTKGDIWSRTGHCTPIDRKTGQPIKINDVDAVGNYVTKYMQKGTKIWHHRMKCTRNLGLTRIQEKIKSFETKVVEALSWKPSTSGQLRSLSSIHSAPQGLVRSLATREIFARRWDSRSMDLKTLMKTNYDHYKRMLKSVRDGARPDRMPSHQFYDWVQKFLPVEEDYCEVRLAKAHKLLEQDFPRQRYKTLPTVIPGNEIGFTHCI